MAKRQPDIRFVNGWFVPNAGEPYVGDLVPEGIYSHVARAAIGYVHGSKRTAIDVGAHIGLWSLLLVQVFEKVVAFEPCSDCFACLERNVGDYSNTELIKCAVADKHGQCRMLEDKSGRSMGRYAKVQDNGPVTVVSIDHFMFKNVGLLKIDVEGMEHLVVEGARETIKKWKPVIIVEDKGHSGRFKQPPGTVVTMLRGMGYQVAEYIKPDYIMVRTSVLKLVNKGREP